MRKALIVGIDQYDFLKDLTGAVNDATSVRAILERHADGTINFQTPQLLTTPGTKPRLTKEQLKKAVRSLFQDDAEIALFYFAGHGYIEDTGGFLCASDSRTGDDGLSLAEVMTLANKSPARNKIIILDSCHSGAAAEDPIAQGVAEIRDGVTILTASAAHQYSKEIPGGGAGVFTNLLVDALSGAAANLVGAITPGSIYAHIDQSLGPWAQRPTFKTSVKSFVSLRTAEAPIALDDLQALVRLFPTADHDLRLDPSFEPERAPNSDPSIPAPNPTNMRDFRILQNCVRVNLVRPVGAPHMWHAAMESKSCELTVLGQHYWRLIQEGLL